MQIFYATKGSPSPFSTGQEWTKQLEIPSARMDPLSDMESKSPAGGETEISHPRAGEDAVESGKDELPARGPLDQAPLSRLLGFSTREIIWLSSLAFAIILIGVFALRLFFGNITTSTAEDVDFPVKGEHLTVGKIETYWRKVNPEADRGVQLGTKFIPAARVTLRSSGSGSLRFLFENPEGDLIGDSVTLTASGGNFLGSKQPSTNINATGGFKDLGDYNEYLTEQVRLWKLVVLEGGPDSESAVFTPFIRMPISPKRR
ncbi:MAG: hypothetical protein CMN02_02570 [Roseibacillus sp.]|nr:hypothetical protein [Roseibacillus sp.]